MSANTKIEWTDHSWSPWWGCVQVSPACDHCYALALDKRVGGSHWAKVGPRRQMSEAHWREPLKWNRKAEQSGARRRVFPSMCDPFEHRADGILDEVRARFFRLIYDTPSLDWLLLTKRPQNVMRLCPQVWLQAGVPANVWIGATVEDRARLHRIDELRKAPAAVRFLSVEPLLEDLGRIDLSGIHWVICGGESGHGARPMHPDWARSLRDQCQAAAVPFFFKQHGDWGPCGFTNGLDSSSKFHRFVDGQHMERVGKVTAGRLLDGREWNEFPKAGGK